MLREIISMRQDGPGARRRWFQDRDIDLFIWQDDAGRPVAMHLCYDRTVDERALIWRQGEGFSHHRVDSGEQLPRAKRSPILLPAGPMPYFAVREKLLAAGADLEPHLRDFVLERLSDYRYELFGRPRRPPRRRARRTQRVAPN